MTKGVISQKSVKSFKMMLFPLFLFILAVIYWDYRIILPIKYLTVFFHELSHGLAAILTGGKTVKITLSSNQGGLCYTAGGWRAIVLSAGYLGSLLWGSALLLLAAKTNKDREVVGALGIMLIIVTAIWVRNMFGAVFCISSGLALLLLGKYASELVCDQFLRFIGLTSCFYVITDIKSDLIDRSVPCSDAYRLAEMFHVPDWLVGGVWFLLALFITYKVVKLCLK